MAVPKRKTSRSNTRSRRANWKATPTTLTTCPQCSAAQAAAHRVPVLRHLRGPSLRASPSAASTRADGPTHVSPSPSSNGDSCAAAARRRVRPLPPRGRGRAGRRAAAAACPDPPLVRVRERRPAQQRAPGVPRRLGARARGHRHAVPRRTPTCPRASWPSCARPWSTCAPSPTSPARSASGDYILLGRGEESTGGRDKASILADTMEAVIGTVYLSRGHAGGGRRSCTTCSTR